jgi:hypothetical protein
MVSFTAGMKLSDKRIKWKQEIYLMKMYKTEAYSANMIKNGQMQW